MCSFTEKKKQIFSLLEKKMNENEEGDYGFLKFCKRCLTIELTEQKLINSFPTTPLTTQPNLHKLPK